PSAETGHPRQRWSRLTIRAAVWPTGGVRQLTSQERADLPISGLAHRRHVHPSSTPRKRMSLDETAGRRSGPVHRFRLIRAIGSLLAISTLGMLAAPAASLAADVPGTVQLSQSAYVAHESTGYLDITITRTDPVGTEYVRYGVKQQDAQSGLDFDAIPNSVAAFQPGQTSFTFHVKILDLGMNAP